MKGCLYDHLGNQLDAKVLRLPGKERTGMAELADGTRKVIASTYTLADVVRRGAERARDRKEPVDADEDMPMVEPVPPDYAAFLYARPDGTEVFFESMCRIQRERAL